MNLSFQNANPRSGDESYLLKFHDDIDEHTSCILVDAGDSVDTDSLLKDSESLSAILVTHGHMDHIQSLADVAAARNVPIYTSPDTAKFLEELLVEGQEHYAGSDTSYLDAATDAISGDRWDTDAVINRLEPIDKWTQLVPGVEAHPISVGHAPGAAGFILRFDDAGSTQHILLTGDFSFSNVAGYDGLATPPVDIDAIFMNSPSAPRDAITEGGVNKPLSDAVDKLYTAATAGQSVVAAAGALNGIHLAYLLNRVVDLGVGNIPIRIAGLAAKVYEDLDYDLEHVDSIPVYGDPMDIIDPGVITITGPEEPVGGGSAALYNAIKDDPNAAFVQLLTSGEPVDGGSCTTARFQYIAHPRAEAIDEFVETVAPMNLVIKHGGHRRYKNKYEASFVWTVDDEHRDFDIYHTGRWHPPGWVREDTERQLRTTNRNAESFEEAFGDAQIADFNPVTRTPIDEHVTASAPENEDPLLYNEGISLEHVNLGSRDVQEVTEKIDETAGDASNGGSPADTDNTESGDAVTATTSMTMTTEPNTNDATADIDASPAGSVGNARSIPDALDAVEKRLQHVEAAVDGQPANGRVVDATDGVALIRVDDAQLAAALQSGSDVELVIREQK